MDALLRFEQAEGRGIAAATTERIEQTRVAGNILIGLAIVIALGTGAAVWRMVGRLGQDTKSLQTEVDEHEGRNKRCERAKRVTGFWSIIPPMQSSSFVTRRSFSLIQQR